MRRRSAVASLVLCTGVGAGLAAARAASGTLLFNVITTSTVERMREAWEPFFAEMRRTTGLDVQGSYAATYGEAVDAVVGNKVQFAWVSAKAALDCIERGNVEVFGQLVDASGSPGYRALIVTRTDSGLASIEQLLSRPRAYGFAMGEASSTSGSAMPSYALFVPRGIKPDQHFQPLLRGTHAQTLAALLAGQVHAATYNTEELLRLREQQPAQAAKLRVLWESALIPKDPLLWRKDLPLSVRNRVAQFLFAYGRNPEERKRLRQMFDLAGFKPSSNQQLRFVLDIEDFRQRSEVLLDAGLTDAQRDERLLDLQDRYARLSRALAAPPNHNAAAQ